MRQALNDPGADPWLDATTKGIPAGAGLLRLSEVGSRGWNVLRGDLPLPVAVLHSGAIASNGAWMADFARLHGLLLAPHGKTTMAPSLFRRQLADGAWAITVATAQQLAVALQAGVRRIILANQPVGSAVDACCGALVTHRDLELYVLADSARGVALLAEGMRKIGSPAAAGSLRVLVEIGSPGARTGCRDVAAAKHVARAVAGQPGLVLAGVEAYEGILPGEASIGALLALMAEGAQAIDAAGLFSGEAIVLSAGGSAWFDLVADALRSIQLSRPVRRVLRSGCYLTLDHFGYANDLARLLEQSRIALPAGSLQPALEIWSHVQSRPDPDKALLSFGKRDVGYDTSLPQPVRWYRPGTMAGPVAAPSGWRITGLNDQHAHLGIPTDAPLEVGDLVAVGVAHPCTTLERWQVLMLVNGQLDVEDAIRTYF